MKLILRLMTDERISIRLKLLPVLSMLYLLLYPDLFPGPIDDAGIIALLNTLFLVFVPREIIQEHKDMLHE
ncbi:MAG: hypothetical protein U9O54_03985 [Chloroflexota bacterium]|nr:hypothetical protein [Chloroflexota bacterium]